MILSKYTQSSLNQFFLLIWPPDGFGYPPTQCIDVGNGRTLYGYRHIPLPNGCSLPVLVRSHSACLQSLHFLISYSRIDLHHHLVGCLLSSRRTRPSRLLSIRIGCISGWSCYGPLRYSPDVGQRVMPTGASLPCLFPFSRKGGEYFSAEVTGGYWVKGANLSLVP